MTDFVMSNINRKLKRLLARLTAAQLARYKELLAGRTNESGRGPMKITDTIRLETIELVLNEARLGGACCEFCIAKAEAKERQHMQSVSSAADSPRARLDNLERRKLNADELRERLAELRARSPLASLAAASGD